MTQVPPRPDLDDEQGSALFDDAEDDVPFEFTWVHGVCAILLVMLLSLALSFAIWALAKDAGDAISNSIPSYSPVPIPTASPYELRASTR